MPRTRLLQLLVDYDDSFVAYINGVEVARANLQLSNTFVPRTAVVNATRNYAGTRTAVAIDPGKNVLVPGANVLSIQTHNASINDGDIAIKADLRIGGTGTTLVTNNSPNWRYMVGSVRPIVDLDGAIEDNPDAPTSVNDWVEIYNAKSTRCRSTAGRSPTPRARRRSGGSPMSASRQVATWS